MTTEKITIELKGKKLAVWKLRTIRFVVSILNSIVYPKSKNKYTLIINVNFEIE